MIRQLDSLEMMAAELQNLQWAVDELLLEIGDANADVDYLLAQIKGHLNALDVVLRNYQPDLGHLSDELREAS